MLKKVVIWICTLSLLMGTCLAAPEVKAPSCLLMDRATGEVLYEKNADERAGTGQRHQGHDPASGHGGH